MHEFKTNKTLDPTAIDTSYIYTHVTNKGQNEDFVTMETTTNKNTQHNIFLVIIVALNGTAP